MMLHFDRFAYFTQFFRCRLILLAHYLRPRRNGGLPRLSSIFEPRNRLKEILGFVLLLLKRSRVSIMLFLNGFLGFRKRSSGCRIPA